MFRFRKTTKGPLGDAKSAGRWLVSLPVNDPLAVQREVTARLSKLAERTARHTPSELKAVFHVDTQTQSVVKSLMAQYAANAGRSPKIENQLWQSLSDLTQAYLACYATFAREIADRALHGKWQALWPELSARQIVHLGRDSSIRLFRCERWIPAKWAELHTVFARACSLQV